MKKKLVIAVLVVIGLGLVAVATVVVIVVNPSTATVSDLDTEPDVALLRERVSALSEPPEFRSWEHPEALNAAADFISQSFADLGAEVTEQTWQVDGDTYHNLITSFGPREAPALVIGAHYDVCGDQPGADDNASGVAVLLELGRLLALHRPSLERRVELVAYSLEEPPFFRTKNMGSAVHARLLAEAGTDIEAMLSLEMLGFYSDAPKSQAYPLPVMGLIYPTTGNFITVVGNLGGRALVRRVKSAMSGASDLPVWSINAPESIPGIDFSDHGNYWLEGYPAIMITDTAFYRNRNYHEPTDTADTLDYERMAEVARGIYAVAVGPSLR